MAYIVRLHCREYNEQVSSLTSPKRANSMTVVLKLAGTLLIGIALLWLLVGFGLIGSQAAPGDVLDSPEESGKLLGTLLPVAFLAGLGIWCWQKPKSK